MLGFLPLSSFITLDSRLVLYSFLFQFKIEYESLVWNSLNFCKLERIQRISAGLCYSKFLNSVCGCKHEDILTTLNFVTFCFRRRQLDTLFLVNVFTGKIS
jgi:hypothetical protein